MGGQIDRAVRRGLHPSEVGLQPRAHHHSQVAPARDSRPAGQVAIPSAAAAGGDCPPQVTRRSLAEPCLRSV